MTQKDQIKVMSAGFRILRADMFRMQIKYKKESHPDWCVLENNFKTKKALLERMNYLLKAPNVIED